jgi:hypothetical protein
MSEQCKNRYQDFLQNKIHQGSGYTHLCTLMHEKEFVWIVPNDDNRVVDGRDQRLRFREENPDCELDLPFVSFLEVLIALSERCEFQNNVEAFYWARIFLENLDLLDMKGRLNKPQREYVDEVLDRVIWRTYKPSGQGGFFPLAWPDKNQTQVELWYQMADYIHEQQIM